MLWISPTGHVDECNCWTNESDAYDGDLGTLAGNSWAAPIGFLQFTLDSAIACSKVRIYAAQQYSGLEDPDLIIEVYYSGAWHEILNGSITKNTWVEIPVGSTESIDKARVKSARPTSTTYHTFVYEFEFEDTNEAPTAPTSLECEAATNPMAVTDLTPEFTAIGNDPNTGDTLTHAEIEVGTTLDGNDMWDSGWIDIADFTEGNRCAAISYAGSALSLDGNLYYWRIRFKDDEDKEGAWSTETANFRMLLNLQETLAINDALNEHLTLVLSETLALSDELKFGWFVHLTETLALSDDMNVHLFLRLTETLDLSDDTKLHITKVFSENLALSDKLSKSLVLVLQERLGLSDKLRLGGLWDDPTTKAIITILKVLLSTAVRNDEVATSVRKDVLRTSVRKDTMTTEILKTDLDAEVR